MKKHLVVVFDSKSKAYLDPISTRTIENAIRSFRASCEEEKSDFSRFAEDYTMHAVGEFDDESGLVTAYDAPRFISKALDFVNKGNLQSL